MKKIWVNADPWNKAIVTRALECGADAVIVPKGYTPKVKELGILRTVAEDGDIKLGTDVVVLEIEGKDDEQTAARSPKDKLLILRMKDWTVIPLENLIAQRGGLFVEVNNSEMARTAAQILEKGVDGVVLRTDDPNEVGKTVEVIHGILPRVELEIAKIVETRILGMGDRVCIDTCTQMAPGQGMLIGNASDAFYLVQSESEENPYVAARPFRVNAGPVHAYILNPEGKTKYLSELKTGDDVLVVNHDGSTQIAAIGRCKIERRPLILVAAEVGGKKVSTILQNAETIRLVQPGGKSASVASLKKGTEVLIHREAGGRHFGMKIEETLQEK
ncbi:MAG: 3-dehydroquinate synthase II [Candidatus Abyssobacteria bacterium SURF_17]|uniref:3-dehydroquinate synthase II n=1 Tax=Candidatus Abyssobacteria bacterium SURF_17 TaxID=2093361 RepID=A0A419F0D8_9BACT|nr:MAG: 3-dehydroquinate synthase II [Candidatus Abyssubacteria bacterium SURF_17]